MPPNTGSQQPPPLARYTSYNALKNLPAETRQVTPQPLLPQYMQKNRTSTRNWPMQPSIVRERIDKIEQQLILATLIQLLKY